MKMQGRGRAYRSDGEGKQPLSAWLTTCTERGEKGEEKAQINCGMTDKRREME
jgi:hypothetical protein